MRLLSISLFPESLRESSVSYFFCNASVGLNHGNKCMQLFLGSLIGWLATAGACLAQETAIESVQTPSSVASAEKLFRDQIAPSLVTHCLVCHGGEKTEGGYSVASFNNLLKAGDSEAVVITPGEVVRSELWRRLTTADPGERMPVDAPALSSTQLAAMRAWIEAGAPLTKTDRDRPLIELATTTRVVAPEHYPQPIAIHDLAIRSRSNEIIVAGYAELTRWDIESGALIGRIPVEGAHVVALDLSRDGSTLAVSSGTPGERGVVELVSLDDTTLPRLTLPATADVASDLAFSPTASRLAIAGHDGSLQLVALSYGDLSLQSKFKFTPHADTILAVAWSANGDQLETASRDRTAKLFDTAKNELAASYDRHERAVGGAGFADNRPITLDETGRLRAMVGDDSDRVLAERSGLPRYLQRFATADADLFVPAGNKLRHCRIVQDEVADGKNTDGKPKQKEVTRIVESEVLAGPASQWITAVSIQGNIIAAGTQQGKVLLWNRENGELTNQFLAQP